MWVVNISYLIYRKVVFDLRHPGLKSVSFFLKKYLVKENNMSYLNRITNAIIKIRDSDRATRDKYNYSRNHGLSLHMIKKLMGADHSQWGYINNALKSGVNKGKLIKTGGKYKVAVIKKKSRKLRKCKYGRDTATGKCRKKSVKRSRKCKHGRDPSTGKCRKKSMKKSRKTSRKRRSRKTSRKRRSRKTSRKRRSRKTRKSKFRNGKRGMRGLNAAARNRGRAQIAGAIALSVLAGLTYDAAAKLVVAQSTEAFRTRHGFKNEHFSKEVKRIVKQMKNRAEWNNPMSVEAVVDVFENAADNANQKLTDNLHNDYSRVLSGLFSQAPVTEEDRRRQNRAYYEKKEELESDKKKVMAKMVDWCSEGWCTNL